jgi:hypothetical protein
MRFYFHISNGEMTAEDEHGLELPTFLAAFEEGSRIAQDLLNDPDTMELRGGAATTSASTPFVVPSLNCVFHAICHTMISRDRASRQNWTRHQCSHPPLQYLLFDFW